MIERRCGARLWLPRGSKEGKAAPDAAVASSEASWPMPDDVRTCSCTRQQHVAGCDHVSHYMLALAMSEQLSRNCRASHSIMFAPVERLPS